MGLFGRQEAEPVQVAGLSLHCEICKGRPETSMWIYGFILLVGLGQDPTSARGAAAINAAKQVVVQAIDPAEIPSAIRIGPVSTRRLPNTRLEPSRHRLVPSCRRVARLIRGVRLEFCLIRRFVCIEEGLHAR